MWTEVNNKFQNHYPSPSHVPINIGPIQKVTKKKVRTKSKQSLIHTKSPLLEPQNFCLQLENREISDRHSGTHIIHWWNPELKETRHFFYCPGQNVSITLLRYSITYVSTPCIIRDSFIIANHHNVTLVVHPLLTSDKTEGPTKCRGLTFHRRYRCGRGYSAMTTYTGHGDRSGRRV